MDWGAFAGGAADGFSKTWKMLKEEEERELIKKERRQALEDKQKARQAASETIGRANTEIQDTNLQKYGGMGSAQAKALDAQTAGMDDQEGIARQTIASARVAQGAPTEALPTEMKGRVYKESEAVGDYARKMAAIDPDKAIALSTQSRSLKQLERQEKLQTEFDEVKTGIQDSIFKLQRMGESGNADGFIKMAKDAGFDVRKKENKDGSVTFEHYKNGKLQETFGTLNEAVGAASSLYLGQMAERYSLLFADNPAAFFSTVLSQNRDRRETKADQRAEAIAPLQQGQIQANIRESDAKSGYYRANADYIRGGKGGDGDKNDPAVIWQKTIEPDLIKQGYKPKEIQEQKDAYFARQGFAPPAAIEVYRTGKMPDGKPLSPADYAAIERRYPKTDFKNLGRPQAAGTPAAAPRAAMNRYDGQKFGLLTPQWMIDEAAAAGNPDARAYKARQEQMQAERSALPLNSGMPF
jgi:hypothetical protein